MPNIPVVNVSWETLADNLAFPEGPVSCLNGDVLLVEIAEPRVTRVKPDGSKNVVANLTGGPNGAAVGPDGNLYICNNGGMEFSRSEKGVFPAGRCADNWSGGRIERLNLNDASLSTLYDGFSAPNDIVFDRHGGFWFTDFGKTQNNSRDLGSLHYALADGSHVETVVPRLETPNGVGLSPEHDVVYVAETITARLWAPPIQAPGKLVPQPMRQSFLAAGNDLRFFDSLAVQQNGLVCVASILHGGILRIDPSAPPQKRLHSFIPTPDPLTTNICFGGDNLKTAYATLSSSGQLVRAVWPDAGLPLAHCAP